MSCEFRFPIQLEDLVAGATASASTSSTANAANNAAKSFTVQTMPDRRQYHSKRPPGQSRSIVRRRLHQLADEIHDDGATAICENQVFDPLFAFSSWFPTLRATHQALLVSVLTSGLNAALEHIQLFARSQGAHAASSAVRHAQAHGNDGDDAMMDDGDDPHAQHHRNITHEDSVNERAMMKKRYRNTVKMYCFLLTLVLQKHEQHLRSAANGGGAGGAPTTSSTSTTSSNARKGATQHKRQRLAAIHDDDDGDDDEEGKNDNNDNNDDDDDDDDDDDEDDDGANTAHSRHHASSSRLASASSPCDWTSCLESILGALVDALKCDAMYALFPQSKPEEAFGNNILTSLCTVFESTTWTRHTSLRELLSRLFALTVTRFRVSTTACSSILGLLLHAEHLPVPLADIVHRVVHDYRSHAFAADLLREIGHLDTTLAVRDNAGAKNVSHFLVEVTTRMPKIVFANLTILEGHLDGDSYLLRNGIIGVLGKLLEKADCVDTQATATATNAAVAAATANAAAAATSSSSSGAGAEPLDSSMAARLSLSHREQLFKLLCERVHDVNAFSRSECLKTLIELVKARALTDEMLLSLPSLAIDRLHDTSSHVRKAAMQLLTVCMTFNPFGPVLDGRSFRKQAEELGTILRRVLEARKQRQMERAQRILQQAVEEAEQGGEEDAARAAADAAEADQVAMDEADDAENFKQHKEEFERLRTARQFIEEMEHACTLIMQLFTSKSSSDVLRAVECMVTAYEFQIIPAKLGVRKMMMLIWSREQTIRDALLEAYRRLYVGDEWRTARDTHKAKLALTVATRLCELCADASMAELTSLEEILHRLTLANAIPAAVVSSVLDIVTASKGVSPSTRCSALSMLSMLSHASAAGISKHVGAVVRVGLSVRSMSDPILVRNACLALSKLTSGAVSTAPSASSASAASASNAADAATSRSAAEQRLHVLQNGAGLNVDALFQRLVAVILDRRAHAAAVDWYTSAEQCISTLFLLHPYPERTCTELLKRMLQWSFENAHADADADAEADTEARADVAMQSAVHDEVADESVDSIDQSTDSVDMAEDNDEEHNEDHDDVAGDRARRAGRSRKQQRGRSHQRRRHALIGNAECLARTIFVAGCVTTRLLVHLEDFEASVKRLRAEAKTKRSAEAARQAQQQASRAPSAAKENADVHANGGGNGDNDDAHASSRSAFAAKRGPERGSLLAKGSLKANAASKSGAPSVTTSAPAPSTSIEEELAVNASEEYELECLRERAEQSLVLIDASADSARKSFLPLFGPLVARILLEPTRYAHPRLQSSAILTLGKFMCVSAAFCEQYIQLLFTVVRQSSQLQLRANAICVLADLASRHPNIVEPWSEHLYAGLSDTSEVVQKYTLIVLTYLILNDMLKPKGPLAGMATCVFHANARIAQIAHLFFHELNQKGKNPIYNLLPDIISRLSADASLDEAAVQRVFKFLLSFIDKERQVESLVEKLCQRFALVNLPSASVLPALLNERESAGAGAGAGAEAVVATADGSSMVVEEAEAEAGANDGGDRASVDATVSVAANEAPPAVADAVDEATATREARAAAEEQLLSANDRQLLRQCRYVSYCLTQLPCTLGALKKLLTLYRVYAPKLGDPEVAGHFVEICIKARKFVRADMKPVLDELEEKIRAGHAEQQQDARMMMNVASSASSSSSSSLSSLASLARDGRAGVEGSDDDASNGPLSTARKSRAGVGSASRSRARGNSVLGTPSSRRRASATKSNRSVASTPVSSRSASSATSSRQSLRRKASSVARRLVDLDEDDDDDESNANANHIAELDEADDIAELAEC